MKAEIIAVGTELLLGQIVNTNAQFISKKFAELGIDVYYHTVLGDNANRLTESIHIAQQRSDLIVFTGGLGPTKDDLTKETIASCLGRELVQDDVAMETIQAYFERRNIPMSENNRKQALVIAGSTVFPNDHGMAPGMAVEVEGVRYVLFPGPPHELHPMFEMYTIPYLQSLSPDKQVVHSKVLRFYGIGESLLEEKLIDLIDAQSNPTIAPLATATGITIRITAKAENLEQANQMIFAVEAKILERVGQFLYGYDNDSLPDVICSCLRQKSLKLALAESCTGGLISRMITSVAGSSDVYVGGIVCYLPDIKQRMLGVPKELIDRFGTVSEEVAAVLAKEARIRFGADIGISVTGIAGPTSIENKPVGLVYIGISSAEGEEVVQIHLSGTREGIQVRAANYALFHLFKKLNQST